MMKQAWRSYIASLHPRNLKKLRDDPAYLWVYIFLLLFYSLTAWIEDDGFGDVVWTVCLRMILPLGLMGWSNLDSRYLMPKAMFLCPMKAGERKEYINNVMVIKIGMMMATSLLTEFIWSILYGFRLWEVLLVPYLFFLVGISVYAGYEVKRDDWGNVPNVVFDKRGNKVRIWLNTMTTTLAICSIALLTCYDAELQEMQQTESTLDLIIGIIGIFVVLATIFAYRVAKDQFKYVIEQSRDYELHFKIKGKEKPRKKYDLFAK